MSKFKKGDWVMESDAQVGKDMLHHGYRIHDVLPDGQYVVEISDNNYVLKSESYLNDCVVEPRCTGWDWVLPEPLIDGPGKYVNRSGKIVEIVRKVSSNIFPSHCWEDTQDMRYRPDGTYNVSDQPCPRDVVSKYVEPPTANRFGLKVGDTVTIKPHDARDGYVSTSHIIVAIEDTYHDGIARFRLDDTRSSRWHPYYFGLCQSDGSPLPPKPAMKKVLLEEWVFLSGFERDKPCSEAVFKWRPVGGHSHGTWSGWTKTGVTRELEVPDAK